MSLFAPTDKKLFFSKNDPDDIRLGDVIKSESRIETIQNKVVIVGYADDRGILNNGGRVGAKEGPTGIRQVLYKLVSPSEGNEKIIDIGDLIPQSSLESDQAMLEMKLDTLNKNSNSILSFGGGHDWAFCDVSSFITRELKNNIRPLVINIDAHLDVRSDYKGINSGTPFFKILERFPEQFDFFQIGIQSHCNSKKHFAYVKEKSSAKIFKKEDVDTLGMEAIVELLKISHRNQPVFLSLDIDAIKAEEAPGCSQSWPGGLSFDSIRILLRGLKTFRFWNHMGIYEVSPPLDVQSITQKSAALAAYEFISHKTGIYGI